MRLLSRVFLVISFTYAFGVFLFIAHMHGTTVKADTSHVVISQIQLNGATANDEFVELYNPTSVAIDLSKWRLTRKSASGASSQNLVASLSGTIAPRSYFLITHPAAMTSILADHVYSSSTSAMTTNNTITLFSDAGVTVVDKVGIGTAADVESTAFATNPDANESLVRKASITSTEDTLSASGSEVTFGNGLDTDNNSTDFVIFTTAAPRNTTSPQAQPNTTPVPSTTPTTMPTNAPTGAPTQTPTPTPTSIPTQTPTSTPTQIPTPTLEPTNTPTPTMTPLPTPTPTITTMPTAQPTAVPTPPMIPTPTPNGQVIIDRSIGSYRRLVCIQTTRSYTFFNTRFHIPSIRCSLINETSIGKDKTFKQHSY